MPKWSTSIALIISTAVLVFQFSSFVHAATQPGYTTSFLTTLVDDSGYAQIYAINLSSGVKTVLTSGAFYHGAPQISPNGTKLLFQAGGTSGSDSNNEIYTMNLDGTNLVQLTTNASLDADPRWFPDGSKIVFDTNRDGGSSRQIYTINADGSNPTRLTTESGYKGVPDVSPDGSQIVYIRSLGTGNGGDEVYVMDSNGDNNTRLTNREGNEGYPSWSIDGQYIIYEQRLAGSDSTIVRIKADGSQSTTLSDSTGRKVRPIYTSDGSKIVYSTNTANVYAIDAAGSEPQPYYQNDTGSSLTIASWITQPNTAPIVPQSTLTLQAGTSSSLNLISKASDEEPLSAAHLSLITSPNHGLATLSSANLTYTANPNYVGSDSVDYKICDSFLVDQKCTTQTLLITVTPQLGLTAIGPITIHGTTQATISTTLPSFSGQTTPLAQVKVEIHSDPIILTTTANTQGYWSVTPLQALPFGTHTVYISSTINGQTTHLDPLVLAITQALPQTGASIHSASSPGVVLVITGLVLLVVIRLHKHSRRVISTCYNK